MLCNSFDHARRVSKTEWKWKGSGICIIRNTQNHNEKPKTPERLSYEMSRNLQQHGPKWKLTNHGLESRNDEVIVIKRMEGQCMEDQ